MSQPAVPSQSPVGPSAKSPGSQKLWLPVVILIGFLFGELIAYVSAEPQPPAGIGGRGGFGTPGTFNQFPRFYSTPLVQFHIVLTTISIALLVTLVVVYVKMYIETKANFSLGLVIVLLALLIEALLSYPLIVGFMGTIYLGPGLSSQFADVFTVCAYAVFLYLSLE